MWPAWGDDGGETQEGREAGAEVEEGQRGGWGVEDSRDTGALGMLDGNGAANWPPVGRGVLGWRAVHHLEISRGRVGEERAGRTPEMLQTAEMKTEKTRREEGEKYNLPRVKLLQRKKVEY